MSYHTFSLAWPNKALWPNGGHGHHFAVHRAKKAARQEAQVEALASGIRRQERAHIHVTWFPKAKGPPPDKDNCIASFKAAQDGIAAALGMNDRDITTSYHVSQDRRGVVVVNVSTGDSADVPLKGAVS